MTLVIRDENGEVTPDTKVDTTADDRAKRLAAIDKLSIEAQRKALDNTTRTDATRAEDDDIEVDLDGVDEKQARVIRKALKDAAEKGKSIRTIAQFGLEQARKAKALEIGLEFGLDKDEIQGIEKALSGANNPDAIDLSGREMVIKLREDGTFAPKSKKAETKTKKDEGDGEGGEKLPPVDTGRSSGANRVAALNEKIDAIEPGDPKAEAELAKLYKEVQQEQQRWEKRRTR